MADASSNAIAAGANILLAVFAAAAFVVSVLAMWRADKANDLSHESNKISERATAIADQTLKLQTESRFFVWCESTYRSPQAVIQNVGASNVIITQFALVFRHERLSREMVIQLENDPPGLVDIERNAFGVVPLDLQGFRNQIREKHERGVRAFALRVTDITGFSAESEPQPTAHVLDRLR